MKKVFCLFLCLQLLAVSSACAQFEVALPAEEAPNRHEITPGSVIDPGGYISFEGLDIYYDGDVFSITNNRKDIVRVSVLVVGVKANGDYDLIQIPAFNGPDKTQQQRDIEQNGWAIEQPTNMVRPGETLFANLYIFDFGDDYPPSDIDGDGYYDIVFGVHPQDSENSIQTSTTDPYSEVYKLVAQ